MNWNNFNILLSDTHIVKKHSLIVAQVVIHGWKGKGT